MYGVAFALRVSYTYRYLNLERKSSMKRVLFAAGSFVAAVVLIGCEPEVKQNAPQQQDPHAGLDMSQFDVATPPPAEEANKVAGITWDIPKGWEIGPARQMRAATYYVASADGDPEKGEMAVFYFGRSEGGDIEANIDRWSNQFENSPKPVREKKKVSGMDVVIVKIAGNYLAPSGPMMQSSGVKQNFRLLGAIVSGPEGTVFFKYTGPAKTVAASEKDFLAMVASFRKM